MKLFYTPGACSLSPHIVACELGLSLELEAVDLKTHTTQSGENYLAVNAKGYVPALQLENAQVLTEGPAIVQYLADLKPEKNLLPPPATLERARVQEWLAFIGTELHKNFSPLFNPDAADEVQASARAAIARRLGYVDQALTGQDYLLGEQFTVADAYLFTIVNWTRFKAIDLTPWPAVAAFMQRVAQRPAVLQALREEGLI